MPTNLKRAQDHPATLLASEAAQIGDKPSGEAPLFGAVRVLRQEFLRQAAGILVEHENKHDVTFAALDNDALDNVRSAYATASSSEYGSDMRQIALNDLVGAVEALLGLAD